MLAPATEPEAVAAVRHLPPAFAALAGERIEQLPAGARGKVGVLRLRFERRGDRTRLTDVYSTGAQRVGRVHYLDPALPDMAVVLIQSVGGGILQGDRLAVDISVAAGARALVTTQAATKVYRMEGNCATQRVTARVEDTGYLEFLTDPLIPYEGARLYTETDLVAPAGGTLVYGEHVTPGRVAAGESFAYRLLHSRLRARDPDGGLRLADNLVLAPSEARPDRPGVLLGHTDLGSMAVLSGRAPAADLAAALHDRLGRAPRTVGGASELPGDDGAFVRVLGESTPTVQAALHEAWRGVRATLLSADVPPIHRVKYGRDPAPGRGQPEGADR